MKSKTTKFQLDYRLLASLDIQSLAPTFQPKEEDEKNNYNAFHFLSFQKYNPVYGCFFKDKDPSININNISLNQKYEFHDLHHVIEYPSKKVIKKEGFIKFSPLLDPIRYMTGNYDLSNPLLISLPSLETPSYPKLEKIHNASYVDCFFSYLSSQLLNHHSFIHGVQFCGSYLGVQEKYKMNITDDYEYLETSAFFHNNINKLFGIYGNTSNYFFNKNSRANKEKININETKRNLSFVSLTALDEHEPEQEQQAKDISNEDETFLVYEKVKTSGGIEDNEEDDDDGDENDEDEDDEEDDDNEHDGESESENDDEHEQEGEKDDEDEQEGENGENSEDNDFESYESSEEETQKFAFINNFPVQMICLEKYDGTLDELFEKQKITNQQQGASILFQIIMTLIAYQKTFQFTHNDLHTNNIMYVNTDADFLFYEYNKKQYKVPTFGKIFKIIDFGRSIYKFQNQILCSDSFAPGGDASTQYNCEPFFNPEIPRLEPNYSFDLCRLGCSIYDFLIDDVNESRDDFQETIYRWCLDDNGKSVLYKKNGEERYKDFKLYKMIAKTVHNHTPEEQLKYPFFSQFLLKTKGKYKKLESGINIDELPAYYN